MLRTLCRANESAEVRKVGAGCRCGLVRGSESHGDWFDSFARTVFQRGGYLEFVFCVQFERRESGDRRSFRTAQEGDRLVGAKNGWPSARLLQVPLSYIAAVGPRRSRV